MAILDLDCTIFDPIRITTSATVPHFIIDTWHESGLILRSCYEQLPGLQTEGMGRVMLSSGMCIDRPRVKLGVQIGNIRGVPVDFFVVDHGAAPLLFGSKFLMQLFNIQSRPIGVPSVWPGPSGPGGVTLEPPEKYAEDTLGIRLVPSEATVNALQLERFLLAVRQIHNVGVIATTGLHQHDDWQGEKSAAKITAVRETINRDRSLWDENTLQVTWVETGSVWISLKSGAKSAFSWLTQIFEKTTDARMRSAIAAAATAEEEAAIAKLTRDDIVRAKSWEQKRIAGENIRATREEWQKAVLSEIDFRQVLAKRIKDKVVREEAQKNLDSALHELVASGFMPLIEQVPTIAEKERDALPVRRQG